MSENELASLLCNIQKKGKLKESLFYIWDEPAYMEDYEQIKQKVNIIRKYASDARILTTFFCGPRNGPRKGDLYAVFDYLKHHIHVATISLAPCKGNEEEVQHIRYKVPEGIDWWSYVCWQPGGNEPNFLLQMKGIQQRAIMWRTWKTVAKVFSIGTVIFITNEIHLLISLICHMVMVYSFILVIYWDVKVL